jgi:hypothetical protein
MIINKITLTFVAFAFVILLIAPNITSAASGRGLFKDVYCAVLSLVNVQCETEIEGIQIKDRASLEQGIMARSQAAVSDAVSRMFSR